MRTGRRTVPSQTVQEGPNGHYAYVIKPDDTVERRAVEVASIQDGIAVVTKGLSPGERVVVDGQYRLTNGARVKPLGAARRVRQAEAAADSTRQHCLLIVRRRSPMSISEPFIRRPIATSLMMLGVLVFGIGAYGLLPVAALPKVDFPTIVVSVNYPGASPDTMASAVATPLEQQFAAIPGLDQMTSTSGIGLAVDHPAIRSRAQYRRRRAGRADRDQRCQRRLAQGPAEPADLPEDQSGGPPGSDLRGPFECDADLSGRRLRLHDPGAEAVDRERRLGSRGFSARNPMRCMSRSTPARWRPAASASKTCAMR